MGTVGGWRSKPHEGALMKKKTTNDDVVEIRGKEVILKRGKSILMRIPLADFVESLAWDQPRSVFSDGSPIPDFVRYIHTRGNSTLVVIELFPQVRQVSWISDDSKIRYGEGTRYESVNLAFPFIVIPTLFINGWMCNYQQLFYRTRPLSSEQDALFLPNLLNVAPAYGYISCFCLKEIENVSGLAMGEQIQKVIQHFWEAGFNESMNPHGGSYWDRMRRVNLDPRISSLECWQRATQEDPLFMLKIPWKIAGVTLQEVVDRMFLKGGVSRLITTASDLVRQIYAIKLRRLPVRSRVEGF